MRAVIPIVDLRAPACLGAVERAVLATRGVRGLEVDLEGAAIVVDFDERATDEADLRRRVRLARDESDGKHASPWPTPGR